MRKDSISTGEKIFTSFLGTLPAAFIVIFMSQGFKAVRDTFADAVVMVLVIYGILLLMWVGTVWFISQQEHPTLSGYLASSAGFLSSMIGIGATVMQFLIPGSS